MQLKEPLRTSKDYVEIVDETEIEEAKKLYEDSVEHRKNIEHQAKSDVAMIWLSDLKEGTNSADEP